MGRFSVSTLRRDCIPNIGWNAHKQCCKGLREGGDRVKPPVDPAAPAAKAPKIKGRTKEVVGFAEPFGPLDMLYHGHPDNYDRATHPVWEHDEGASGRPRWTRCVWTPPKKAGGKTALPMVDSHGNRQPLQIYHQRLLARLCRRDTLAVLRGRILAKVARFD